MGQCAAPPPRPLASRCRAPRPRPAGTALVRQRVVDRPGALPPGVAGRDIWLATRRRAERCEPLDANEQARLHLKMFGMELGAAGLARMRVSEHAVHTWDVVVALDPAATVAPDAVALLIDTLDRL